MIGEVGGGGRGDWKGGGIREFEEEEEEEIRRWRCVA